VDQRLRQLDQGVLQSVVAVPMLKKENRLQKSETAIELLIGISPITLL
jgi:hypothetical protein